MTNSHSPDTRLAAHASPKSTSASSKRAEPYLLTPGPLTTAFEVKEAMLRDWGSWDDDFRAMTVTLRRELLAMINDREGGFDCVPIQGSGTFAVEAMLGTFIRPDSKTLVLANGAYGKRIAEALTYMGRAFTLIDKGDFLPPRGHEVSVALEADPDLAQVVVVHCETSSGILNPIAEIAEVTKKAGRRLLIDSMSAFGALPLDVSTITYDAIASSANKCIEGVPGFGFVIARKTALEAAKGNSHSLSLDLYAQWTVMNATRQWRFTPPTHVVAAFLKALEIHKAEGGVSGRLARYEANCETLVSGMRALGFETLLSEPWLSPIIVTFFTPDHPNFTFNAFYQAMKERGFIIYPGKLTAVDSFRIGCIGRLDQSVMREVVAAVAQSLAALGVDKTTPAPIALAQRNTLINNQN